MLATGDDKLDSYVKSLPWVEVVATARYREAVPDSARSSKAEVLLLSAYLKGSEDIREAVFVARAAGLRVVFLAGSMNKDDPLVADLIALGVYDLLFDRITVNDIEERLRTPAPFGEAVRLIRVGRAPEGKRLAGILSQFASVVQPEAHEEAEKGGMEKERPALRLSRPKMALPRIRLPSVRLPAAHVAREPPQGAESGTKPVDSSVPPESALPAEEGPLRLVRPAVAVWSPVAAGKTFVAVNLARALAGRFKVAFADLAPDRAAHAWLLGPEGEDSLRQALEASALRDLSPGFRVGGFTAYLSDPNLPAPVVKLESLRRFLSSPQVDAEVIVLDLPSALPAWGERLLEACVTVLVGDPDYAHCIAVREAYRKLAKLGCVLVANRCAEPDAPGWDLAEALGGKPAAEFPCAPEAVYGAVAAGRFAADLPDFKDGFSALAGKAAALLRARKGDADAEDPDGVPAGPRLALGAHGGA